MKLIDADALCEDLMERWNLADKRKEELIRAVMADVVTPIVVSQPTIEQSRWIPCSERLPEDGERVLATHLGGLNPDKQVIEHIYVNGKFTMGWDMDMNVDSPTFGQRYIGNVIAWMPMPEPYREGGEQE